MFYIQCIKEGYGKDGYEYYCHECGRLIPDDEYECPECC